MKKILVPTDFSKQAKNALDLAIQLARMADAKIHVMHAVEFPVGGLVDPVGVAAVPAYDHEFLDALKGKGEEKMAKFLDDFDQSKIEHTIEIGSVIANIDEQLARNDYDLVIMGTKGASGLKEFFLGSNTEKVIRVAKCPVIVVHEKVDASKIKNIVFATLEKGFSEDLIMHIKQLQDLFKATLHIVRVNTPNNFERDIFARPMLQKMADEQMLKDYTINIHNDIYEEDGIISFTNLIKGDMIALGTHGRKGLSHAIAGSLAEDLANHANKLIWTYHIKKD